MKINYQKLTDEEIKKTALRKTAPRLLLHSCCGPCSSYVLEYLTKHFKVSLLFYNPNIFPESEYEKRLEAQKKLIDAAYCENEVELITAEYDHAVFLSAAEGLFEEKEGGARCAECFRLRLEETAKTAKEQGFDYFTTTLSVSPHKNAEVLNSIGKELSEKYGVPYLFSDFKKREGYKRSIVLSSEYGLYRQEYCGCEFSIG